MFDLFRSIGRGRSKDNSGIRVVQNIWSPFTQSPERSRHDPRRKHVHNDAEYDEPDEEEQDEHSPHQQLSIRRGYFDRSHRSAEGNHRHAQYEDNSDQEEGHNSQEEEGEDAVDTPLLPIFSSAHLDRLPLYNITHAIRQLIVARCETTLSWEQLRSPQISQFLVKPVQSQIRADHFNRATLCALIANCLQFQKEGQMNPGNVGVCRTRAMISELLTMRLLREFSTRELIDSLSYDFDPLQGMSLPTSGNPTPGHATPGVGSDNQIRRHSRVARVSTIEIAIRAEAKRFLAHPLVVQHLEAIWAGNVVFHSEADNLHRRHRRSQRNYGTTSRHSASALPADAIFSRKANAGRHDQKQPEAPLARRTVTLYNPRDASLFKLSRLRVPRYRQVFSTVSFATMLALFVAVLSERNLDITPLEILFWFWSVGYMLDEVVGFTEQGFGLYIMSFWNAFDLGILFLFGVYYCLRIYGVVLAEEGKHKIAGVAYDVLASTAILLFPRLFSVLDHYKYFSQLLIAFRMMAQDLVAILVLIAIGCSGFFVALSLSFADTRDANGVAYSLFQILMGFTPAVWDHWDNYNILGKSIMVSFLTICHFLVVTILITVLTNSFMAIVKNAEEEHQFLFAINTISMVKSDALFSYVAPSNIFGWVLSPLRFVIPLRAYVKFNRTIIKLSHFPILFVIFSYERIIMARGVYGPTDLVERQPVSQKQPVAFGLNKAPDLYSSTNRLREPSVISFNKDQALDEVFRRPFRGDTVRTTTREMEPDRRDSSNAVDQWMQAADIEGGASPPMEQPRSVLERLENRRPRYRRSVTSDRRRMLKSPRDFPTATRSVASNPDLLSNRPHRIDEESEDLQASAEALPQDTEADGDDEINEESDDNATPAVGESAISVRQRSPANESESEYFQTPMGPRSPLMQLSHAARARLPDSSQMYLIPPVLERTQAPLRKSHIRQTSSGTILFAPQINDANSTSNQVRPSRGPVSKRSSGGGTPPAAVLLDSEVLKFPSSKPAPPSKPRPIMPARQKTVPNMTQAGLTFLDMPPSRRRNPSFSARALDLASDLGDNKFVSALGGGVDMGGISGMPASFSEQLMRERELERRAEAERRRSEEEEKGMVNRIMLARMHTLEEGFREVLKEIKDLSQNATATSAAASRRDSEADSGSLMGPNGQLRGKPLRGPRVDTGPSTATSGSGAPAPPKTPIGRIGGNEKSKKASPRKAAVGVARQQSRKGRENDRPRSSGGAEGWAWSSQPVDVGAAGEEEQQNHPWLATEDRVDLQGPKAEGPEARPQTARPGTAIRSHDSDALVERRDGE